MVVNYPIVDVQSTDAERHRRDLALGVNGLRDGKLNSAIDVMLDPSPAETTTFSHPKLSNTARVLMQPGDAVAAADLAAGAIRIDAANIGNGNATIQHTRYSGARLLRISFLS